MNKIITGLAGVFLAASVALGIHSGINVSRAETRFQKNYDYNQSNQFKGLKKAMEIWQKLFCL